MTTRLIAALAILLPFGVPALAHRLDEYLQATLISLEKDRVQATMRLVPGVAVFSAVLANIDTDGDSVISASEGRAYAERVLRDLSLEVDGHRLKPRLVSVDLASIVQMKEGLGEIEIGFSADLPRGGRNRKLIFENHHQSRISAYLVNCLVPRDRNIQVVAQNRNENQSFYQLDYLQAGGRADPLSFGSWWSGVHAWPSNAGGLRSMFRLGMWHIAEGTDHLLFLLTLLLPAPLLAFRFSWAAPAGARHTLVQISKVVTAFTVGHSITLALAAFGVVRVPSRPIEILVAVSILVSSAHAIRPLFPGREGGIAAFFGLIHGLAFATTLGALGLGRWERVASILGFNLGIETMQLFVVAATMPSLVLLSRTRAYSALRTGGALLAGAAAVGWIAERLLGVHNPVDLLVNSVTHHALWIAGILFLSSVIACSLGGWRVRPDCDSRQPNAEPA